MRTAELSPHESIRIGGLPDTGDVVRLGMREASERPEWLARL